MTTLDPLFPLGQIGLVGQTVDPNPKCNGCLHYDSQRGQGGVCTIGLRPFTCGAGDMPLIGYAPLAHLVADFQPMAPLAQASDGKDGKDNVTVAMKTVALGEEHVEMVKSRVRDALGQHASPWQRTGTSSLSTAGFHSMPEAPVNQRVIVKSIVDSLNNAERFVLGDHAEGFVTSFVRHVMNGERDIGEIHKSVVHDALTKGFYGHDWLAQFKGTDLFDEAVQLCEEEIEREEARIKRDLERARRRKQVEAKMRETDAPVWEEQYAKDNQLRLKKDKLQIRLAKLQQKNLVKMTKSGEGARGGNIIGHTKSGKPVYGSRYATHAAYKDFSSKDHYDAADLHERHTKTKWLVKDHEIMANRASGKKEERMTTDERDAHMAKK